MAQEERNREMPHSVILEGREKLTISGVTDVHSFDEEQCCSKPCGACWSCAVRDCM